MKNIKIINSRWFLTINKDELTKVKFLHLESWMEIRGKLQKISEDDYHLFLAVDNKVLVIKKEFNETSYIMDNLKQNYLGKEIAILKTDIPDKPLLIQFISKKD